MKPNTRLAALFLCAAFATCLLPERAAADNSTYITIQKGRQYDQTTSGAPVADPWQPFDFDVSGNSSLTMSFTPPGGSSTPVTTSQNNSSPEFYQTYGTQAALDAAFPDGNYTLSVNGFSAFTLSLTGDLYPPVPQVVGGTWNSSGQLVIDPTSSYTMNFNAFPGYTSSGAAGHMQINIYQFNGNSKVVNVSALSSSSQAALTSQVIASGTLQPGSAYQGQLGYDTATQFNSTAVTGYTGVSLYSMSTTFTIVTSGTATNLPVINSQPTNQTAPLGGSAIFQIGWTNGNNIEVQWFRNGIAINNQNNDSSNLSINDVQSSDFASYYCLLINSSGGYVQSNTVTLKVGASSSPTISNQPSSITVATGSTAVFNITASGSPEPTFQWSFNGSPISGATSSTLTISNSSGANAGTYTCTATNGSGSVTSNPATLAVTSSSPSRLINISARAFVGTGGNVLIAGYVIEGSGQLPVLLRSSGPALIPQGVTGILPDPQLQLYSGQTMVDSNAGWGGNALIVSTASAVGAYPWPSASSKDSALLENQNGAYTGITSGVSGDTGIALAEVYDATPGGTTPTARLANISARSFVGTGGNVLIAGFVISGTTAKTVLIRASGPALIPQGVTGVLSDPQLQLYSGQTVIASNAGWGGNASIVAAASQVGAYPWPSSTSNDSAILVTLNPGAYTAIVSGASGDSGIALAEVYDVQ